MSLLLFSIKTSSLFFLPINCEISRNFCFSRLHLTNFANFLEILIFFYITQLQKKKSLGTLRIKINSCINSSNFYYIVYIGEVYFAWPFFFFLFTKSKNFLMTLLNSYLRVGTSVGWFLNGNWFLNLFSIWISY